MMKGFLRHTMLIVGVLFFLDGVLTPPYTTYLALFADLVCCFGIVFIVKAWYEGGNEDH